MGECEYYKTRGKRSFSNQVGGRERTLAEESKVHYCLHPNHSPFDLEEADAALKTGFAIEEKLKCGGNRASCPLSQEEFDEILGRIGTT